MTKPQNHFLNLKYIFSVKIQENIHGNEFSLWKLSIKKVTNQFSNKSVVPKHVLVASTRLRHETERL